MLALLAAIASPAGHRAIASEPYLRLVRVIDASHRHDQPHDLVFGPRRVAVDRAAGQRYTLDERRPRLVVSRMDDPSEPLSAIRLHPLDGPGHAIALDPSRLRLHVLAGDRSELIEVTTSGSVVATRDLSALRLKGAVSIAFAASGDPTDDASTLSLYVAAEEHSSIYELELEAPAQVAMPAAEPATLVRVIETSEWSPPSPDPSGIAEMPASGRLIISDSEVNEIERLFQGVNVFVASRDGTLLDTASTTSFSREPTDVAVDEDAGRWFFSDDNDRRVIEVRLGPDGLFGTADDIITFFSTRAFGSTDPEGLAYGQGLLLVADGLGREIYIVAPGPNGHFDGVAPTGDDIVTHFDTAALGQQDPEGVEYNAASGTLFIISNTRHAVVLEATLAGEPLRVIDISAAAMRSPAGLAYAPASSGTGRNLYIVDRNVDNNADPDENDGRLVELAIDRPHPTPTGTPVPGSPVPRPTLPGTGDIYLPLVGH
jgi:uncharacterized protein YjiK